MTNTPCILLYTKRQETVDNTFFGSMYIAKPNKIYKYIGLNPDTVYFMRSLVKPLQASIMCDYNIISDYGLTKKELAMFCASHSGSPKHIEQLKNIMKRFNIKQSDLNLTAQKPLDERKFKGRISKLHNNCSAKHLMMLLMCKYLNFEYKNYTNENHPLQKLIHKKQDELSQYKSTILTHDGCGTPLWGLPAKNIIKAYFNFFHDDKYKILYESILSNPYLYGGYDRFDSEIIKLGNKNLFSKVGAGGFVIVYNFKLDEILLVKMTQNNNNARKLITLDILNKLGWIKKPSVKYEYNQMQEPVAKYCYEFKI